MVITKIKTDKAEGNVYSKRVVGTDYYYFLPVIYTILVQENIYL